MITIYFLGKKDVENSFIVDYSDAGASMQRCFAAKGTCAVLNKEPTAEVGDTTKTSSITKLVKQKKFAPNRVQIIIDIQKSSA